MYNQEEEQTERTVTFFRFEDLRIYHKSLTYINWLNDLSMQFPDDDKTQLIQRFNHAARNITFYIAEGSSRNKSQFIYYLKMAKSSIRECLVCTTIAHNANSITDVQEEESRGVLMEMTKMIGALISSLQRSSRESNQQGNDYNSNGRSNYDERMPMEHNHNLIGDY
jgi:four helix bundle protein